MEDFVTRLTEKVGIERATAEKVFAFLKEHAADVPRWLQSDTGKAVLEKAKAGISSVFSG